jgi:hypothetical protein
MTGRPVTRRRALAVLAWCGLPLWAGLAQAEGGRAGGPAALRVEPAQNLEGPAGRQRELSDPTRATPQFESTFRELSKGFKGAGGDKAAPATPKSPKISLVARIVGAGRRGAVILKKDDQVFSLSLGEEASLMTEGGPVTLKLEELNENQVKLLLLAPYNETIILH